MGLITGLLKFAAGGAVGAVIGAGVAAMFAPQSGEELQATIRERIEAGKRAQAEAEIETRRALEAEFRRKVNDETAFRGTTPNGTRSS
jgi:gas vesicle protein